MSVSLINSPVNDLSMSVSLVNIPVNELSICHWITTLLCLSRGLIALMS
jgi:hypothetical protein